MVIFILYKKIYFRYTFLSEEFFYFPRDDLLIIHKHLES